MDGYVARIEGKRNAYRILKGKLGRGTKCVQY